MSGADLREAATQLHREANGQRIEAESADHRGIKALGDMHRREETRKRAVAALLDAIAVTVAYDDDRGIFLGVDGPIQRAGRAVAAAVLGEPPTAPQPDPGRCPTCGHTSHSSLGFCPNMASDNDCNCRHGEPPTERNQP